MKKIILVAALGLAAAACTDSSQSNLSNSVNRAGDSFENVADGAGERIENAIDDTGRAIDNGAEEAGNRASRVGDAIENAVR